MVTAAATRQEGGRGDGATTKRFEDETPVQRVLDLTATLLSQDVADRRGVCDSLRERLA